MLQICPHDSAPFGKLCEAFAMAGRDAGIEVTTVILDHPSGDPHADFIYLGAKRLRQAGALLRKHPALAEHLKSKRKDYWNLVLCHRYRSFAAALRLRIKRRRIAVLAHEFDMLSSWRRRALRLLVAPGTRFGGVSPVVAAQLAKRTRMGFVLPNVLNLDEFQAQLLTREAALERLNLPDHELTVAVVGRLHYKKRPDLALQAFNIFQATHPEARLVFVGAGDGGAGQAIKRTLDDAGATTLGAVTNASSCFGAFDVLLHTGKVESFGMVILEAMAAGVPVVVADGGGPEYVLGELGAYPTTDNAEGYAEAITRALATDLPAYRKAALQRCEKLFSIPAVSRSLNAMVEFVSKEETDPFAR